ncbi:bifunctional helix-turn-helix transcriptional regulator/GNAT family N-acetyltransferase [Hyunsoonleella sp. SJ7]|uniref:Bifunctional helix-turn-helix transcriptional regulator/GNAT family N-acetyltransferase n=1 Tax=Hyunsoonleella aquatilis TaxID=2762758 RepID=A0A923KMG3_9FLAO|nr:bifunctional helix-turn-helix transcriptional regulator/GNAT family N-acetyltransferase [Hyunsoonleella aquatilis]MBC3759035.1 bifunctional helix-turn-helix transcriptional regulator/GNAT family N-acetyltransferase [Hyunsoonleella aquatilis]
MDALQGFGELGLGSRLKRISEYLMKEGQLIYDHFEIDFDPYLFPVFKLISQKDGITNTEIYNALSLTQPAITQSINKLTRKGLIDFENHDTDKRKKIIHLSTKGKKLLKQLQPIWKSIDSVIKEFSMERSTSLIAHLNSFENKIKAQSFSKTVIESLGNQQHSLQISTFQNTEAEKKAFYNLNEEWLRTFFYVEPFDEEVLSKPDKHIIDKGGHIFFAKLNGEIVGTVALMPLPKQNTFELTKMAVSPKHRGQNIGQQLMVYCLEFAKKMGLPNLILYSSRKLENAIYIYRKYGFVEIPVEADCHYKRCDIKMEVLF